MARSAYGNTGIYNASAITLSDGEGAAIALDSSGNAKVTLATTIAGEDIANDVLKVEERYSYSGVIAADTLVKTGSGFLHCITVSQADAAPTAGTIILYDNTAESGTQIFNWSVLTSTFLPFTIFFDVAFTTGLYAGFTTTADVNLQISYR